VRVCVHTRTRGPRESAFTARGTRRGSEISSTRAYSQSATEPCGSTLVLQIPDSALGARKLGRDRRSPPIHFTIACKQTRPVFGARTLTARQIPDIGNRTNKIDALVADVTALPQWGCFGVNRGWTRSDDRRIPQTGSGCLFGRSRISRTRCRETEK